MQLPHLCTTPARAAGAAAPERPSMVTANVVQLSPCQENAFQLVTVDVPILSAHL
jgi:hypothetical protein